MLLIGPLLLMSMVCAEEAKLPEPDPLPCVEPVAYGALPYSVLPNDVLPYEDWLLNEAIGRCPSRARHGADSFTDTGV